MLKTVFLKYVLSIKDKCCQVVYSSTDPVSENIKSCYVKNQSGNSVVFQNKTNSFIVQKINSLAKNNTIDSCLLIHCDLTKGQIEKLFKKYKIKYLFVRSNNKHIANLYSRVVKNNNEYVLSIRDNGSLVMTNNNDLCSEKYIEQIKKLSVDSVEFFDCFFYQNSNPMKIMKFINNFDKQDIWLFKPNIIINRSVVRQFSQLNNLLENLSNKDSLQGNNSVEFVDSYGFPHNKTQWQTIVRLNKSKKSKESLDKFTWQLNSNNLNKAMDLINNKSSGKIIIRNSNLLKLNNTDANFNKLAKILLQAHDIVFESCVIDSKTANLLIDMYNDREVTNNKMTLKCIRCEADSNSTAKKLQAIVSSFSNEMDNILGEFLKNIGGTTMTMASPSMMDPTGAQGGNDEESQKYNTLINNLEKNDPNYTKIIELYKSYKSTSSQSPDKTIKKKKLDALLSLPSLTWKPVTDMKGDSDYWISQLKNLHDKIKEIFNIFIIGNDGIKDKIISCIINGLRTGTFEKWILLVGPPGTGKTAFLQALGAAFAYIDQWYKDVVINNKKQAPTLDKKELNKNVLSKNYWSVIHTNQINSREDLEGHKEVYSGSVPGSLFNAMCKDQQDTEKRYFRIIGIDELDKTGTSAKGNEINDCFLSKADSSAVNFSDKYIGDNFRFNLKKILFVATANSEAPIKGPLKDRLIIIPVSGYTEKEKFHIVKNKLLDEQLKKNYMSKKHVNITDSAIKQVVKQSGNNKQLSVRQLELDISNIISKAHDEYVETKKLVTIDEKNLSKYFSGGSTNFLEEENLISEPGVINIFVMDNDGQMSPAKITVSMVSKEYSANYGQYEILGLYEESKTYSNSRDLKQSIQSTLMTAIPAAITENNQFLSILPTLKQNYFTIQIHGKNSVKTEEEGSIALGMALAILSLLNDQKIKQNVYCYGSMDNRGKITFANKVDFTSRIKNAINSLHQYSPNATLTVLFNKYSSRDNKILKDEIIGVLKDNGIDTKFINIEFANNIIEAFEKSRLSVDYQSSAKSSKLRNLV